jgi:hypothetical protein
MDTLDGRDIGLLSKPAPSEAVADRDSTIGEWLKDCLIADPHDTAFNRLVGTIRQRSNTSTSSSSGASPANSISALLREPTTRFQECCSGTCCSNVDDNEIHLRRDEELRVFDAVYQSTLSEPSAPTEAGSEVSGI